MKIFRLAMLVLTACAMLTFAGVAGAQLVIGNIGHFIFNAGIAVCHYLIHLAFLEIDR